VSPTIVTFELLLEAKPALTEIGPLRSITSPPEHTLFHAGPPLPDPLAPPAPLLNGIAAAAKLEGWASSTAATLKAVAEGGIRLMPAQDAGIVTPLAYVVGPSCICLKVEDLARPGAFVVAPLNDGPPPAALRFGAGRADGLAIVRDLIERTGADLTQALRGPTPLLPAMAAALAAGDDLHGKVSTMQTEIRGAFDDTVAPETAAYLERAGQFALNVVMAAAALMIGAGAGIADSQMVVACGGNGETFGYKRAGAPDKWEVAPASRPIGPRLPGCEDTIPLPAIGDSAVIDALGFGAACLRFCPELALALQRQFDDHELPGAFLDERAHAAFIGPHPALGNDRIRLGLDLTRPRDCLGIMLGMVEETGHHGLIGRGVAPWPER
jgi:hypothetical protein